MQCAEEIYTKSFLLQPSLQVKPMKEHFSLQSFIGTSRKIKLVNLVKILIEFYLKQGENF